MHSNLPLEAFEPLFEPDQYSDTDTWHLAPFFTNLDSSVFVPLIFSPELIGALCSRASRATRDLRHIYLNEFIYPFVSPTRTEKDSEESWKEKVAYGKELKWFIDFIREHPLTEVFSNPRARSFYVTWLAQYGDDSIAQMAGMHLGFASISQVAIKHPEDQRIGLAPIEKSSRYVNFGQKVKGHYVYYTDPTLESLGLKEEYERAMDGLFSRYNELIPKLSAWLAKKFSEEKPGVVEKKAFDTLRGLLPMSTLSQVAFFGNGQAFEYMITRSLGHSLGEIRWMATRSKEELAKLAPSFFRRLDETDAEKKKLLSEYQEYLAGRGRRASPFVDEFFGAKKGVVGGEMKFGPTKAEVRLIEHDPEGENKVITGMLYSAPNMRVAWSEIFERVKRMSGAEKEKIVAAYMEGRSKRFHKAGRAFENAYVRFEVVMNNGAWRDLQRHRMLTQQRQLFTCVHGFDIPPEVTEAGLEAEFKEPIMGAEEVFAKIASRDLELAQYAVTMAHRIQFMQWENTRQCFWELELRSIPEGHPDYRVVEQEKFRQLEKVYPLISKYMLVNMGEYDFARRGQEEKIQKKAEELLKNL